MDLAFANHTQRPTPRKPHVNLSMTMLCMQPVTYHVHSK